MRPRAPAVVPAHAHLLAADLEHGLRHRRQLKAVGRVFNLVGRPGQRGKLPAVQPQAQPLAPAVRHLRPADAGAVAALLGQQIGRQVLRRAVIPDAQPRALPAVGMVFRRTQAVEAHPVIFRLQARDHAEFRHVSQALHGIVPQRHIHPAAGAHPVGHEAAGRGLGRQIVDHAEGYAAVRLPDGPLSAVPLRVLPVQPGPHVQRSDLPLGIALGHAVAVVVVRGRPPEIGHQRGLQQLRVPPAVGIQRAGQPAEHDGEMLSPHGDVPGAVHVLQRGLRRPLRRFSRHLPDPLAEGDFMPGVRPGRISAQAEAHRRRVFARQRLLREGHRHHRLAQRRHVRFHLRLRHDSSVPRQGHHAAVRRGGGEHVPVDDPDLVPAHPGHDVLIIVFDLLQLRGLPPVGEDDAVAAENAVRRPVAPVPAVEQGIPVKPAPGHERLVHKVPDEAALIQLLLIGHLRILVHRAVGVAHGMGIFAEDEGLLPVLPEIFADLRGGGVHLALDVRHIPHPHLPGHVGIPLVVHQAGGIQPLEFPRHLQNHLAGQALVPAGPDQHAGMVFIPLHQGAHPVQQQRRPLHAVAGHHVLKADPALEPPVPHAVALHVVLVDHIQAQLVAQGIERAGVRIVAGADGVDVVPLHQEQRLADLLRGHGPPRLSAEVVPVHALEHDPHAVHPHHASADFDFPEAHPLPDVFRFSGGRGQRQIQVIQRRILRGPQLGPPGPDPAAHPVSVRVPGFLLHGAVAAAQRHGQPAAGRRVHPGLPGQQPVPGALLGLRRHPQIPDMGLGNRVEINIPVQAGKAQEVLILQPAPGAPAVHPAGQLVFPVHQGLRQLKLVGREAVRGKADILSVEPYGHAALRSLEGDEHPPAAHALRQLKMPHVAAHGVKPRGNVPRLQILLPVPGVFRIGVLRRAVALHLHVRRHMDALPAPAVILRLLEARNHLPGVHRVKELPQSVQAAAQGHVAPVPLRLGQIKPVIRMGIQPVFPIVPRIPETLHFKHVFQRTFPYIPPSGTAAPFASAHLIYYPVFRGKSQ